MEPLLNSKFRHLFLVVLLNLTLSPFSELFPQPAGFVDQIFLGGWNQVVGFTWDSNDRMYVWEKAGRIWIVENGARLPEPLLDISEEVGGWRDFGLLGVALDPDFLNNGYIYLLYVVDRHHLLNFGTPNYNPAANEYYDATIGRVTRYQATAASNFTAVDPTSRTILIGETPSSGMPILHESHGVGHLVFGTDGTLLVSMGDGASYSSVDQGSASETYWQQALMDGIITEQENIGAYRCQLLDSHNGKILRIDPSTGDGAPSNPFYDAANPRAPRSRVWGMGVRNPYRLCKIPGTGSTNPADGDPGDFIFGDVGWNRGEELSLITAAGQNFGWPKYEGMTHQPGYNNTSYTPAVHELPKVDWRRNAPRVFVDGQILEVGTAFPGPTFQGNASTGGVWYSGTDFPAEYQNTYFHADYGKGWIRNFTFDQNYNPTEIRNFISNAGAIVFVGADPSVEGLFYVKYPNQIRQVTHTGAANQAPVAVASADVTEGPSPLAVQFTGDASYDPEFLSLTYNWDFGDGATSTDANPSHTFDESNGSTFTVRLTVTDPGGLQDEATLIISLDNTSPTIVATSIDEIDTYSMDQNTTLPLSATVTDNESSVSELTFSWQVALFHNDHNHPEAPDNNPETSVVLTPIGCDGNTYWYRITLTVTDPGGLSTVYEKDIFPDCPGLSQSITFDPLPDQQATDPSFDINATTTSGLPPVFFVTEGPATISGNTVNLLGIPGIVTVVATQPGDATYAPARPVFQSFSVNAPTFSNCTASGSISREVWTGIGGTAVSDIPLDSPPDIVDELTSFEIPVNVMENYGTRIRGFLCPPETGQYIFWIASDDNGELWLSTDEDPANKTLIASVPTWTSSREWDKFPEQESAPIQLNAGQSYYVEALMKEHGGGDNLAVRWQLPSGIIEEPISGSHLSPFTDKLDQTISIIPVEDLFITNPPFAVSPTSSSGLPVEVEVVSGPASVNENTITLNSTPGTVILKYSQAGNEEYNPAPEVFDNFEVLDDPPTVVLDSPAEGSSIAGSTVTVEYTLSGDLVNGHVDHLHLTLDDLPYIAVHHLTGSYTLNDVPVGNHTLEAQLVNSSHEPLLNPESTFVVNFSTTAESADLSIEIDLQSRSDHSGNYAIEFYQPGATDPEATYSEVAGPDGILSISNIPSGSYDVLVTRELFLKRIMSSVLLGPGSNNLAFTTGAGKELKGGDADGDNSVSIVDFSILAATFNFKLGDTAYDGRADFNGDEEVSLIDFSILAGNFNMNGDEPGNTPE